MSRDDLDRWETRYRASASAPSAPESFVVRTTDGLVRGVAIDVAGGTGRHALHLAARGWRVTLTDIAPAGLARARRAAEQAGWSLATEAIDLDDAEATARALPETAVDLIVCTWFFPSTSLWARMADALKPAAHLVYVQPTRSNLKRHDKPSRRFLFDDGELANHLAQLGLDVVVSEEGWDDRGHHTARALARRPA